MDSQNTTNTANRLSNQSVQIDTNGVMSKEGYFGKYPGTREILEDYFREHPRTSEMFERFLRNINDVSKLNKSTDVDLNEIFPRKAEDVRLRPGQKIVSPEDYFQKNIQKAIDFIEAYNALQNNAQTEERKSNDEYRSPYAGSSRERARTTNVQNLQQTRRQSADGVKSGI